MALKDEEPAGLHRVLGRFDATCVVIGAIIGVGIFFTPSRVAAISGDALTALWTWAAGGLIAMMGALTFAELGALYPRTGGQYAILRDAYGNATAFVYVFCNATAIQAASIAVIGLVCASNTMVAVGGIDPSSSATSSFAAATIIVIALANAAGVRFGASIQNVTVVAKLAVLGAIAAAALGVAPHEGSEAVRPVGSALGAVMIGVVPVLFSFGGWQQALWMGGEVRNPTRNLPFAIIVGVAMVIAVYLAANWAYLHVLGPAGVAGSQALAADTAAVLLGDAGRRAVAGAVAVSALGVLNAQLLTGPRLVLALAADGRFFSPFATVHPRRGTPIAAIALMAVISLLLLTFAGAEGIDRLLTGIVFVDGLFFALTGLASIVLGGRHPHSGRPVRMPGYPFVPFAFAIAEIGCVVGAWMDPSVRSAAFVGAIWIFGAAVLYRLRFHTPRTR